MKGLTILSTLSLAVWLPLQGVAEDSKLGLFAAHGDQPSSPARVPEIAGTRFGRTNIS